MEGKRGDGAEIRRIVGGAKDILFIKTKKSCRFTEDPGVVRVALTT